MAQPNWKISLLLVNLLIFNFLEKTNCQNRHFHYRFENLIANDPGLFASEAKLEATPDGGCVLVQREWATDIIFAVKMDSCGEVEWAKKLGGMPPFTTCSGVQVDAAGELAMIFQRYDLSGDDFVFAIKLDAAGKIVWQKKIVFAGSLGKADFQLASDGRFCFGSNFDDGSTSSHHLIFLNSETGALDVAYQISTSTGSAGVPFYANLPNGNLLVRRIGEWFSFNLETENVDWAVRFNDPDDGWERTKPLVLGNKLLYSSLKNPLPTSGRLLLRFFDLQGKYLFSGDEFSGEQDKSSSIGVSPRKLTALSGGRFAVATTQKTPELQWSLLLFDSLGRQILTKHFHPKTTLFRRAHDQVLLGDGRMAVLGESAGRLELLKISPEETIDFCVGDMVSLPVAAALTNISPKPPPNYQVKKVQFPVENLSLSEADFDLKIEKICDLTEVLPDLDSTLTLCSRDSAVVRAGAGLAADCVWDDGFEGCERVLRAGDGSKTANVRVRCANFLQKFTVEEKTDCPCDIHFPTAFTPNGDGTNDSFRPVSDCRFLLFDFKIYNRWGQVVFASANFDEAWDGTSDGLPAVMDLYFFTLKYRTAAAGTTEILSSGEVNLLR